MESSAPAVTKNEPDPRSVFVVYGHDKVKDYVWTYLQAIGLHPIAWTEALKKTGDPAAFIGDILEAGFQNPQAVVVILTGDDMARVKEPYGSEKLREQPRANVLFEAGMALGRFPKRTIFVQVGEIRPFSDLAGRHVFRLDKNKGGLKDLAEQLKLLGCAVDEQHVPLEDSDLAARDRQRTVELRRRFFSGLVAACLVIGLAGGLFGHSIFARLATIGVTGEINTSNPLDIYFVAGYTNKIAPGTLNTQFRQQEEKVKVLFVESAKVMSDADVQISHGRLMLPAYPRVVKNVLPDEDAERFLHGNR